MKSLSLKSLKESWFTNVWQSRLHQATRLYYSIKERNIEMFKKYLHRIYAWVDYTHACTYSRYIEDEAHLKYVLNKSLGCACSHGTPEMVKLLIDGKGSIKARVYLCMFDYKDEYDYTRYTRNSGKDSALMIACQREPSVETTQIVEILFHTAQHYLLYPLMEAIKRANVDVVRIFMEEGKGFSVREHITLVSSAKQTGNTDIVNYIEAFVEREREREREREKEKLRKESIMVIREDWAPKIQWTYNSDDLPPMHG